MRRLKSFLTDNAGAAAAEMALITPLALVLIFAMAEGGYYLWSEHKVIKGVRDAARYAARLDFSNYGCPAGTINNAVVPTIKNLTRTGQLSGGTAKVPGWGSNANDVDVTVTCTAGSGGIYGAVAGNAPKVKVSASPTYPSLFGALGFTNATLTLRAEAQSAVMGL